MKKVIIDLYKNIRKISPDSLKGILTKLVFTFSSKPFVKKDDIELSAKFPNKEKGGLIISADFEMAWAWRFTKTNANYIEKGRIERKNLPKIIKVLEEFNIPITFATVGHLFLEKCQKRDHDWMSRIPHFNDHWKFVEGDWYDHDPHTNYQDSPEWYAPDLIRMIIDSKVEHEIGTHTFSHIDFSDKNCPTQVAVDEIKASQEAAKTFGINLESIVFPGGTWGNIEALKRRNFLIYRRNLENYDISYPYRDKYGLLVSPSSGVLELNSNYNWSVEYFLKRLKKYINKAIKTGTIAHFWFHPSLNPMILERVFPKFFEFVSEKREKGNLWIGSMNKIAKHINENKVC